MESKGSPTVRYARRRRSEPSEMEDTTASTTSPAAPASGPNMKMKLKPRRTETKNARTETSKVGAKLNDAFERLVATLGYDPTQEGESDAMAMDDDEEDEPIVVVEKGKKKMTKTSAPKAKDDDRSVGGLAAGLQTLAKQLHSIGHTDVAPFVAESEGLQYDQDIDDFDLCEEVVSSEEEPAVGAVAPAPATNTLTTQSPIKRGLAEDTNDVVERTPSTVERSPRIKKWEETTAIKVAAVVEKRGETSVGEKARRADDHDVAESEQRETTLKEKETIKTVADNSSKKDQEDKLLDDFFASSEDDEDDQEKEKTIKKKKKKILKSKKKDQTRKQVEERRHSDDSDEEEDRRPIGERIRERKMDDGEEDDEEDELLQFLNDKLSDGDDDDVAEQRINAKDVDYEPSTSASSSKKRRRADSDEDNNGDDDVHEEKEDVHEHQSKRQRSGKKRAKKDGPPSKRQKKKMAKEVESAREKASRVTQKILRQGRLNFERIEAPEMDAQALASRLIRRSAILRNTPMAVPRLSADTKPPRPGRGGLYVCPPSALGEKPEQDVQIVKTVPKSNPVAEEEKAMEQEESEPIQMPAGWASLEMPMETTQDLWSMSRGDDEPIEKNSEASAPTEQQQPQLDAVALTYEPTLDASMSLAPPLTDACTATTPALAADEDDDLESIFGGEGAAAARGSKNGQHNVEDDEEGDAVAELKAVPELKPSSDEPELVDDEDALIAELEGRGDEEEDEQADDDDDEEDEEDASESRAKATTSYHALWQNEREDEELKAIMRRFCPSQLGEDGNDEDDDEDDYARGGHQDEDQRRVVASHQQKSGMQVWDMYDKDDQEEDDDDDDEEEEGDNDDDSDKENGKATTRKPTNIKYNGGGRKPLSSSKGGVMKKPATSAAGSIFGAGRSSSAVSSASISLTSSLPMMDDEDEAETMNLIKRIQKTNTLY